MRPKKVSKITPMSYVDIHVDKFGRPFLGHHNYILSLSVLCLGVEDFKRNNACSLYDLIGHAPAQEPRLRGS